MPGLIGSLLLLITGAIAKYAYSDSVWTWTMDGERQSLQVETVGNILLIAGLVALLLSVAYAFMQRNHVVEEEVVYDDYDEPEILPTHRPTVVQKEADVVPPVKPSRSRRRKTIE